MSSTAPSTLTPHEISFDLQVSVRTVQNLLKQGAIPAVRAGAKHWRCRREDYEAWKATPTNGGADPTLAQLPPAPVATRRAKPAAKRPIGRNGGAA